MILIVSQGNNLSQHSINKPLLTLGRHPKNDVTLMDAELSREHCRLHSEGEILRLEDLGSTNGTYVNGIRVKDRNLLIGDTIQLGSTLMLVANEHSSTDSSPDDHTAVVAIDTNTRNLIRETIVQLFLSNCGQRAPENLEGLLKSILSGVIEATGFDRGMILLPGKPGQFNYRLGLDDQGLELEKSQQHYSRTVLREALNTRTLIRIIEDGMDGYAGQLSLKRTGARSTLCIPLIPPQRGSAYQNQGRATIPGFIYLDSRLKNPKVDNEVEDLLEALGLHAAMALENEFLHHKALHDPLTGLHNRGTFDEHFRKAYARAGAEGGRLGLLIMDVDHFKSVNDNYGHPVGDEVLKELAARLKTCFRKSDFLARYGGEEFVVCLDQVDAFSATQLAERARQRIMASPMSSQTLNITASIGVALFDTDHQQSPEELLKQADQALYRAKKQGRNRVYMWTKKGPEPSATQLSPLDTSNIPPFPFVGLLILDRLRTETPSRALALTVLEALTDAMGAESSSIEAQRPTKAGPNTHILNLNHLDQNLGVIVLSKNPRYKFVEPHWDYIARHIAQTLANAQ